MPYFERAIKPIEDGVIIYIHAIPSAKLTRNTTLGSISKTY